MEMSLTHNKTVIRNVNGKSENDVVLHCIRTICTEVIWLMACNNVLCAKSGIHTHTHTKTPSQNNKKTQCVYIRNSCVVQFLKGANKGSEQLKRWKWNGNRACKGDKENGWNCFLSFYFDMEGGGVECCVYFNSRGMLGKTTVSVRVLMLSMVSFHLNAFDFMAGKEEEICSNATPAKEPFSIPHATTPT